MYPAPAEVPEVTDAPGYRRYRYREFGEENTAEFDDAHLAWSGSFESTTSTAHGEYQDRLRAIHLRKQGWSKTDIAKDIGRSERFVARWWQLEPLAVPRPPGVHQYLAHTMAGQKQVDRTEMWRGVEVVRGFFKDTKGLYNEVISGFANWKQSASETKDFRTASYFLRYDHEGKMKMMTMKSASYQRFVVPRLDTLVQKIHEKVGVQDPDHGAGMYWFSDGDASVGSHRHVFWSARVALGAERIMMVDKTPILMQEGDLIIIGPQRHGVPSMPEISEGSLRISVPFKPNRDKSSLNRHQAPSPRTADAQQDGRRDDDDDDHHHQHHDEDEGELKQWWEGDEDQVGGGADVASSVQVLMDMGFDADASRSALQLCGDVEQAIEALTNSGLADMLTNMSAADGRNDGGCDESDVDVALARKLQMEELQQESPEQLQQQFEEYEKLLEIDDAEKAWDGYGDLMHNSFRRANLNLDMLGAQTLYSLGAAAQTEKAFFELLSLHSIRVVYDFRPTDYRDEVRCQQPHFEIRVLKSNCRQRGIHYRHVAVGRETAWGTLKHLQSDEVQHIMVELVWRAKHHARTAFLGQEEDWRADGRLAIAEELVKHGHVVQHVRSEGSLERHMVGMEMPDFLLQEEARLRKVHAQRKAGELHRPEKSAVNRSLESVARSLATEKIQVDVSAELRDAENQTDLVRAQKRMVRLQVTENKKEAGLGKKELVAVPAHIAREAASVREQAEAKKMDKLKSKAAGSTGSAGNSALQEPGSSASSSSQARVQTEASVAASTTEGHAPSHTDMQPVRRTRWGQAIESTESRETDDVEVATAAQIPDAQPISGSSRKSRWDRRTAT
ncbi:BRIX1 [Symbiodinium natans]|uniref:BRIX1 protein n=1 Tax=Symbiodinium natans TaxID=878477 RepID=A0A812PTG5_9DINO|nr:BRIX1 [Symbiodinium natans]